MALGVDIHTYQGRSKRSGWSGFGWTTISQGKSKVPFYKKQVINKSTRVIFGLVQLIILQYNYYIKAYDEVENNRPPTQTRILYATQGIYSIAQKLSNKQSAKVICRFNRLRIAHSKRQTSHISIGILIGCPYI